MDKPAFSRLKVVFSRPGLSARSRTPPDWTGLSAPPCPRQWHVTCPARTWQGHVTWPTAWQGHVTCPTAWQGHVFRWRLSIVRVRWGARSVTVQISSRRHMQLLSRGDLVDENDGLYRESIILTFGLKGY